MQENPQTTLASESILVVDDEEELLDIYEYVLSEKGYNVIKSANPNEAMELMAKHSVFLVFVDFRMPQMNGATLCGKIKEKYPQTPVVIISAYSHEARMSLDAARIGADDVLSKPCANQELATIVARYANNRLTQLTEELDGFTVLKR